MTAARGSNPAEELAIQTTLTAETSGDLWLCGFSSAWDALLHELCCLAQPWHRLSVGTASCRVDTDPWGCLALCK